MKILVATRKTQGKRSSDFCFVPEGEPVWLGFTCDKDRHDPDGECGCARSVTGVRDLRGTTTFMVVEYNGDVVSYTRLITRAISESLERPLTNEDDSMIAQEVGVIYWIASRFPVGTVLERRGERKFRPRSLRQRIRSFLESVFQ